MRVLVVEDHPRLAATVATVLRREGMAVDVAFDGREALDRAALTDYDVVVLDRDLPGVHGDDVCRSLAKAGRSAVLMLTAAGSVEDRVEGLGIGADDYLPKPFHLSELVARIRALGRRSRRALPPRLVFRDLELDSAHRLVTRAGQPVALTAKEFAVLEVLLGAQGAVVSTEEILERAWDDATDPFTNAVRMTISRLRAKLGDPPVIETVTPVGYRIGDGVTRLDGLRHPKTAVRWRLTLLYGGLFLACGAALLAVTYALVSHATLTVESGPMFAVDGPPLANAVRPRHAPEQVAHRALAEDIAAAPPARPEDAGRPSRRQVRRQPPARRRSAPARGRVGDRAGDHGAHLGGLGWLVAGRVLRPLEQAYDAQRRFVANASHELRTPLTASRALLEMVDHRPGGDHRHVPRDVSRRARGERATGAVDRRAARARPGRTGRRGPRDPVDLARSCATRCASMGRQRRRAPRLRRCARARAVSATGGCSCGWSPTCFRTQSGTTFRRGTCAWRWEAATAGPCCGLSTADRSCRPRRWTAC